MSITKQEAIKLISDQLRIAYKAIANAEKLSRENGVEFEFAPSYGMGGTFYPNGDGGYNLAPGASGLLTSSQSC